MNEMYTITFPADHDLEDCLAGAERAYIEANPSLKGYDLSPRWDDEDTRDSVTLVIPASFVRSLFGMGAIEFAELCGDVVLAKHGDIKNPFRSHVTPYEAAAVCRTDPRPIHLVPLATVRGEK